MGRDQIHGIAHQLFCLQKRTSVQCLGLDYLSGTYWLVLIFALQLQGYGGLLGNVRLRGSIDDSIVSVLSFTSMKSKQFRAQESFLRARARSVYHA